MYNYYQLWYLVNMMHFKLNEQSIQEMITMNLRIDQNHWNFIRK